MPELQHSTEEFVQLLSRHEPALRAFIRACLPRESDVDDVMQEVSLVAWRKFSTLAETQLFPQWACLIARYEILAFRRRHARDRLILSEELINQIADEGAAEISLRRCQLGVLNGCIERLSAQHRELLLAAYAPGASKKELAARVRRTEGSLYQLLARIRRTLLQCVENTIAAQGGTL